MDEKAALLGFLEAQRASVLAIIDGLTDGLTASVLPSKWTPPDTPDTSTSCVS